MNIELETLTNLCKTHDFHFQYTDDHGRWAKSMKQQNKINAEVERLGNMGLRGEAENLVREYRENFGKKRTK